MLDSLKGAAKLRRQPSRSSTLTESVKIQVTLYVENKAKLLAADNGK
jgi:hypothetical protein